MHLDNSVCGVTLTQKSFSCSDGDKAADLFGGVMAEAKKVEASYRNRYRENAAVMSAIDAVLSVRCAGLRSYFTKELLSEAVQHIEAQEQDECLQKFLVGAQYLIAHWADLSTGPYMAADGSITAQSAADGRKRMCAEQEAIADRIIATEYNARALTRSVKTTEENNSRNCGPKYPAPIIKPIPARGVVQVSGLAMV